jgi:hypothetical protein
METTKGRITGESMKAIVVSTPRTCSSYIQNIFAHKFDLIDYSELFSEMWVKADAHTKLKIIKRSDNYTAKITSTSLTMYPHIFDYRTFPWEIFDYIVVTERLDIAEQAASWLLLSHAQLTDKGEQNLLVEYLRDGMQHPEDFPDIDRDQLRTILQTINHFHNEVKPHLLNSRLKSVKLVNHEMFQRPPQEYIEELRDKTDIYWRVEDLILQGNPTYVDYTPYIETKKLREVIEEIQNELKGIPTQTEVSDAPTEETSHEHERPEPTEGEGTI